MRGIVKRGYGTTSHLPLRHLLHLSPLYRWSSNRLVRAPFTRMLLRQRPCPTSPTGAGNSSGTIARVASIIIITIITTTHTLGITSSSSKATRLLPPLAKGPSRLPHSPTLVRLAYTFTLVMCDLRPSTTGLVAAVSNNAIIFLRAFDFHDDLFPAVSRAVMFIRYTQFRSSHCISKHFTHRLIRTHSLAYIAPQLYFIHYIRDIAFFFFMVHFQCRVVSW